MELQAKKLVTIVAETVLWDQLLPKLREIGATGYTCCEATGVGSRGARKGYGGDNVRVEVACSEEVASKILRLISDAYFEHYACIAWVIDASVTWQAP